MVRQITSAFGRFAGTIGKFSIAQRTIAIIGIAVLVLGVTAFATWALKPSYSPLFSGLAAADASAIVEQLRTDGVPYQITEGGGTILVPEDKVYDERMKSAAAGFPSSTTGGYSLLDKMGVTSSEFQQSVTYKRAMEGELASTIASLDGVKTASVHLAIPEKTVFVSKTADPTASVFVDTKNGVTLNREQVQAIVHLTSAVGGRHGTRPTSPSSTPRATCSPSSAATRPEPPAPAPPTTKSGVRSAVQTMLDRVVGSGQRHRRRRRRHEPGVGRAHRGIVHHPGRRTGAQRSHQQAERAGRRGQRHRSPRPGQHRRPRARPATPAAPPPRASPRTTRSTRSPSPEPSRPERSNARPSQSRSTPRSRRTWTSRRSPPWCPPRRASAPTAATRSPSRSSTSTTAAPPKPRPRSTPARKPPPPRHSPR